MGCRNDKVETPKYQEYETPQFRCMMEDLTKCTARVHYDQSDHDIIEKCTIGDISPSVHDALRLVAQLFNGQYKRLDKPLTEFKGAQLFVVHDRSLPPGLDPQYIGGDRRYNNEWYAQHNFDRLEGALNKAPERNITFLEGARFICEPIINEQAAVQHNDRAVSITEVWGVASNDPASLEKRADEISSLVSCEDIGAVFAPNQHSQIYFEMIEKAPDLLISAVRIMADRKPAYRSNEETYFMMFLVAVLFDKGKVSESEAKDIFTQAKISEKEIKGYLYEVGNDIVGEFDAGAVIRKLFRIEP